VPEFVPPADAEAFASSEGTIFLWFPTPGVVAARAVGFIPGRVARAAYERIDAEPRIPYTGFLDLSESSGFDWSARMQMVHWNVQHLSAEMRFHLLIPPRYILPTRFLVHLLGDRVSFHHESPSFASAYALVAKRKARA
jgi:hypothetical protein